MYQSAALSGATFGDILKVWHCPTAQWNAFRRWEKKDRGLLVRLGFTLVSAGSAVVGNNLNGRGGDLMITASAVFINNRIQVFEDAEKKLHVVTILETMDPKVMKFEYRFTVSGSKQKGVIHIPVPKGKLGEAVRLMNTLNQRVGAL